MAAVGPNSARPRPRCRGVACDNHLNCHLCLSLVCHLGSPSAQKCGRIIHSCRNTRPWPQRMEATQHAIAMPSCTLCCTSPMRRRQTLWALLSAIHAAAAILPPQIPLWSLSLTSFQLVRPFRPLTTPQAPRHALQRRDSPRRPMASSSNATNIIVASGRGAHPRARPRRS
jgi:hypothetical protein